MKIYISGPITGHSNYLQEFFMTEMKLKEEYPEASIINPAAVNSMLPGDTTYNQYMDMCYLMLDMADAIYMMEKWGKSKGACIEYGYALAKDKIILNVGGKCNGND